VRKQDEKYILKALDSARRGLGSVEPNPAVGCIIVKGNQIIGKGWHRKFGGPHAEINALKDCKTLGMDPKGAAMYVTLEPCCRQGKTPPCTDAIIKAGIRKVFVATLDPSSDMNGRGVQQLRDAGIEVETGLCEKQAKLLNTPFIKFAVTGRCWTILKWAQSIDGKLAYAQQGTERKWISNELSRKDSHILRRRAGAVVVGINTVLDDDPLLTPMPGRKDRKAIRVVLDSRLRIPMDSQLLKTAGKNPVVVFTSNFALYKQPDLAEALSAKGAELLVYPDTHGRSNLHFLLDELSRRGISQVLVEGGVTVLKSFFEENLADEICIYIAPKVLGARGSVGIDKALADLKQQLDLHYVEVESFDGDVRITGLTKKALKELSITQ